MTGSFSNGVSPISAQEMRTLAVEAAVNVPIEQTWVWYEFDEAIPGRSLAGFYSIIDDGRAVAVMALERVHTDGVDFLSTPNGPVWLVPLSVDLEQRVVEMIVSWAKKEHPWAAFIRMQLAFEPRNIADAARAQTSDHSTVVSLIGGEEGILSQFSERARDAVTKARAVSPVVVTDETELAGKDFAPYFALLEQGEVAPEFASWGLETYRSLIERLSPAHVRLYAARYEGQLISWLIFTVSGVEAVCEWSARSGASADIDALAQTALFGATDLSKQGIERLELREEVHSEAHKHGSLAFLRRELTGEYTETTVTYDIPLNRITEGLMRLVSGLKGFLGR